VTMDSYVAMRICPRASASSWWAAAHQRRDRPAAIAALLAGRGRIEVTPEEAADALAWAGGIAGWAGADPKPVWLYRPEKAAGG
jgi:hypothetical protein